MPSFRSNSFPFRPAAPRPKAAPVLAVGSRATVTCATGTAGAVVLRDHADHRTLATLGEGTEVEIVAWQPHRTEGARYRVRVLDGADEGWVGAARLVARPRP